MRSHEDMRHSYMQINISSLSLLLLSYFYSLSSALFCGIFLCFDDKAQGLVVSKIIP